MKREQDGSFKRIQHCSSESEAGEISQAASFRETAMRVPPPRERELLRELRSHRYTTKLLSNARDEGMFSESHVSVRMSTWYSVSAEASLRSSSLVLKPRVFW